jgi:hypothetical protein
MLPSQYNGTHSGNESKTGESWRKFMHIHVCLVTQCNDIRFTFKNKRKSHRK